MAHSEFQVRLLIKRPAVAKEELQRQKGMSISSTVYANLRTQDDKNQRNIKRKLGMFQKCTKRRAICRMINRGF